METNDQQRSLKFIDLFAGIGGFRLGIERALPGARCLYTNEWDKYASSIYVRRFGGDVDLRDIRAVATSEIPDHDLLVGGFPCQAFSVAGKRLGFEDTRGTLFFEIARILRDKRPRYLLLENVKGLLSHDNGQTFQTILGVLTDLGYELEWEVLNSKDFGVPQNRERVFIIGSLRGQPRSQVFRLRTDAGLPDGVVPQEGQAYATTLRAKQGGPDIDHTYIAPTLHGFEHGTNGNLQKQLAGIGMIRRLTPMECERLQGFPDGWTADLSDTQRYKCLGNAVTVNVIEAVISQMFSSQARR